MHFTGQKDMYRAALANKTTNLSEEDLELLWEAIIQSV